MLTKEWMNKMKMIIKPFVSLFFVFAFFTFTSCEFDLDEVLAVHVPGRVTADALDNPDLSETLVNSVIGDTECALANMIAAASHHSDEWMPGSGNLTMRNWGQRKIYSTDAGYSQSPCSGWGYQLYTPLHTARFQSEDVYDRLTGFEGVDGVAEMQATVRAYGGYALIALGETWCRMAIDGGPELSRADVLAVAEQKFTEAISLSTSDDIKNMALVGRARARIGMGDWSGALSDASLVPNDYVKYATRDGSDPTRYNKIFDQLNNVNDETSKHGSIADHFRALTLDAEGLPTSTEGDTPDSRVSVVTDSTLTFDFATIFYYSDSKHLSRADYLVMASGKEALMFSAEAKARSGDSAGAIEDMNTLRTLAGVSTITGTPEDILSLVIEERRRNFFLEGSHRLADMIRFRGTAYEIPFLGEPGSIHPTGFDQTGAEYGILTCFELPTVEVNGNPNIGS
jgi:hypothetical protein|tara:strand:+ start:4539 stop:5906 length:1368 start_codon:yes stop_codon:yes gene_type:complete